MNLFNDFLNTISDTEVRKQRKMLLYIVCKVDESKRGEGFHYIRKKQQE